MKNFEYKMFRKVWYEYKDEVNLYDNTTTLKVLFEYIEEIDNEGWEIINKHECRRETEAAYIVELFCKRKVKK